MYGKRRIYRKRKQTTKPKRKSNVRRKWHGTKSKSLSPRANFASIVETYDAGDVVINQPYEIKEQLSNFSRASTVAKEYQFYRLTRIELEFQVKYNQYRDDATSSAATPHFYMMKNRNGSLPNYFDNEYMLAQGCKPIQFTRDRKFGWKPNTLITTGVQDTTIGQPTSGTEVMYDRWISSYYAQNDLNEPPVLNDQVDFYGLGFLVNQPTGHTVDNVIANLTIRCHWEFKDPAVQPPKPPADGKTTTLVRKV